MLHSTSHSFSSCRVAHVCGVLPSNRSKRSLIYTPRATKNTSSGDNNDNEVSSVAIGVAVAGLALSPIAFWSEYTLATTGAGLQGSDILGALEGISYVAFVGIVAWSLKTKIQTGSGLPAGPNGLVGAAEGVSYLALLGALGAAAYSTLVAQ